MTAAPAPAKPRGNRLWRYNIRILLGTGFWILVLPIVASQLVTLMMMALAADFSQEFGTRIAEVLTPIMAAFLTAHTLAPEYRSGVGAVLACKPLSLHRVLTARVAIGMGFALLLTTITLVVCSVGLKPIDLLPPLLAALPSLWFLSLLALTFATLFRSAFGGFAVAAAVWAVDFGMGYGVNPFFSLAGLSAFLEHDPLAVVWVWSKVCLSLGGVVLLLIHARLLPRICRAPEARDVPRMVTAALGAVVLYCASGALMVVGYAYVNRGSLNSPDVIWLRRQLKHYGPIPVSALFGPAFQAYVAEIKSPEEGEPVTPLRIRHLEGSLRRWPRSMWADGMAFTIALDRERVDLEASVADYLRVADAYGGSPFAPKALGRILSMERDSGGGKQLAARRLLADYPKRPEAEKAAAFLSADSTLPAAERLRAADIAAAVAPRQRVPGWLVTRAELLLAAGRTDEARKVAAEARAQVIRLEEERRAGGVMSVLAPHQAELRRALDDADKILGR